MERYNRNILISGFGEEGQIRLKAARVLVIGSGGLGSPVLFYLAAAGVGTLGIIDHDTVDLSNLQRQILHFTGDVGKDKVVSAAEKLRALNPEINVISHKEMLDRENATSLITSYDFVVDCCDNFKTKYLIDEICVRLQKPYSHGSVIGMQGEVLTYTPGNACYRDVFPEMPADGGPFSSAQAGILGAMAGVTGSIQATEVIKYIIGAGDLLTNRLLLIDGRTMQFQTLKVNPLTS